MASVQARLGWKRQGKGENKNYGFFLFLPNALQKYPKKIAKKIQKYHYGFISSQNRLEETKKERK